LKSLDLSENRITNIIGPQDPEDFKLLESLRLNDNDLKEWSSIDQLGLYKSLTSLWIANNPVMAKAAEDATADNSGKPDVRTITIARMAHINQLNGTEVSDTGDD
jgi:Leucine-rich repeat (LRR) protein